MKTKGNTILESTRSKAILKFINGLPGFKAAKRHQGGWNRKGDPDITGCGGPYGRRIEFETKQPGQKPTPLQEIRLREWSEAGAAVGVVYDVQSARELLILHGLLQ